jgi:NAD(P)-dependent dehydrogenase (short-subunit alcohol dehydrogenase family)
VSLDNKTILITGATGSFGKALITRILADHDPAAIRPYSCDELKQSDLQRRYVDEDRLRFLIGDVRDLPRLTRGNAGRRGRGCDAARAGAALIGNLNSTGRDAVVRVPKTIANTGGDVLGVVATGVVSGLSCYDGYGYGHDGKTAAEYVNGDDRSGALAQGQAEKPLISPRRRRGLVAALILGFEAGVRVGRGSPVAGSSLTFRKARS